MPVIEIPLSFPLDDEGFLRRECPHCRREFKWLPSEDSEEPDPGGYFCPYCRRQADADAWWTKAQLKFAEAAVVREVVDPELDKLERSVRRLGRSAGGFMTARLERPLRRSRPSLAEANDMRRVDFACHPGEPVKIAAEWARPVHCLLCGHPA